MNGYFLIYQIHSQQASAPCMALTAWLCDLSSVRINEPSVWQQRGGCFNFTVMIPLMIISCEFTMLLMVPPPKKQQQRMVGARVQLSLPSSGSRGGYSKCWVRPKWSYCCLMLLTLYTVSYYYIISIHIPIQSPYLQWTNPIKSPFWLVQSMEYTTHLHYSLVKSQFWMARPFRSLLP